MNLQDAQSLKHLVLTGQDLTISQTASVARFGATVSLDEKAEQRVQQCRDVVDVVIAHKMIIYGINTGFGALRNHIVPDEQMSELQRNLIRSHACGVGTPLSPEVVRAAILLRANTLARGNSGVRVEIIHALISMLNLGICPWIPSQGSVGASGDLCPLSHIALVLMGDPAGKFVIWPQKNNQDGADHCNCDKDCDCGCQDGADHCDCDDTKKKPSNNANCNCGKDCQCGCQDGADHCDCDCSGRSTNLDISHIFLHAMPSTPEKLQKFGFQPIALSYKEGLGLNNGTQIMSALAAIVLYDSYWLLHSAELALAMSLEGIQGVATSLDERIHNVRALPQQPEVALRLRTYIQGSANLSSFWNGRFLNQICQQAYALQKYCQEQLPNDIEGNTILKHIISKLQKIIDTEINSVKNNPLLPCQISYNREGLQQAITQSLELQSQINLLKSKADKQYFDKEDGNMHDDYKPLYKLASQARTLVDLISKAVATSCPTQDDYSFRCAPQVLACAWRAWQHAAEVITIEINSATDNPLIFPPTMPPQTSQNQTDSTQPATPEQAGQQRRLYREWLLQHPEICWNAVVSGGNFHGEPVGMVMDYLAIALAEVASISERRTAHLIDSHHNNGLPAFLIEEAGLNSGLMIPQYTAAALVSENKILAHPATVDSIPTSANTEDHVSMATIAARKCQQILCNATQVIAIEFCTSHQALYFRFLPFSPIVQKLHTYLEKLPNKLEPEGMKFVTKDVIWYSRIATIADAIHNQHIADMARN